PPVDLERTFLLVDAQRPRQEADGTADMHLAQGEERIGIGRVGRTNRALRASWHAAAQQALGRQQHPCHAESETCEHDSSKIARVVRLDRWVSPTRITSIRD